MIVLSIDPGKTCGLAVVSLAKPDSERLLWTGSQDFAAVYEYCLEGSFSAQTPNGPRPLLRVGDLDVIADAIVIEDTRNQPIHAKRRGGNSRVMAKKARAVGRIDAMIDFLEARARSLSVPVVLVEPTSQKWDHALYRRITGVTAKRSNQHERDAVRNAWGLTQHHVEQAIHDALTDTDETDHASTA